MLQGLVNYASREAVINSLPMETSGATKNIKLNLVLALVDEFGTTLEYLVHGSSDPKSRDSSGKFRTPKPAGRNNNRV